MPKLPKVTTEEVCSWDACEGWDESLIHATALECAVPQPSNALERIECMRGHIEDADLLWVVCRPELIPQQVVNRWALWMSAEAARKGAWPPRSNKGHSYKTPARIAVHSAPFIGWEAIWDDLCERLREYESDVPPPRPPRTMGR